MKTGSDLGFETTAAEPPMNPSICLDCKHAHVSGRSHRRDRMPQIDPEQTALDAADNDQSELIPLRPTWPHQTDFCVQHGGTFNQ